MIACGRRVRAFAGCANVGHWPAGLNVPLMHKNTTRTPTAVYKQVVDIYIRLSIWLHKHTGTAPQTWRQTDEWQPTSILTPFVQISSSRFDQLYQRMVDIHIRLSIWLHKHTGTAPQTWRQTDEWQSTSILTPFVQISSSRFDQSSHPSFA